MTKADFLNGVPPPWQIFPEIAPTELEAYLKQGVTEAWFDQHWRPFWGSLTESQRARYLDHWSASPAWREAMGIFTAHADIDLAADAAESEEYLERWRAKNPVKLPLWRRLFGRK